MAKALKKIKKVSSKIRSLSGKVRKLAESSAEAVRKAVVRKKPLAKVTRRPAVKEAAPTRKAKFSALSLAPEKYSLIKEVAGPVSRENRIAKILKPVDQPKAQALNAGLPQGYDKDLVVLQVRDPWWLHAYWEVRESTWGKLKNELARLFETAKKVLRVYDVSFINFNGSNAHRSFDIEMHHDARSWYIDTAGPGRSWCVDFGLRLSDGRFITIARSNIVTTPLDGPSWVTDEEWMVPDELFSRLYASSVGLGGSPVKLKQPWLAARKMAQGSGGISSGSFSPAKKEELKRNFWLVVNTELIVYGATEPDAKVSVCGKEINLRPDGTFSLRFSLPDGEQVIPVEAVSADKFDKRIITPVVTRETR